MANLNPNMSGLMPRDRVAEEKTCHRPIQVKVIPSQYEAWMSIPVKERQEYLREAIAKKLAEKNLLSS